MGNEADYTYFIDGAPVTVTLGGIDGVSFGADQVLSSPATDPTFGREWYSRGFDITPIFDAAETAALQQGIRQALVRILSDLRVDLGDAPLEQYHRFVDDEVHYHVVKRTRDLFPADFDLDIVALHDRLGQRSGFPLTDVIPGRTERLHIIIRIIRPGSTDFNPVHKDIYEAVDNYGLVPPMMNFWLPICGVGPHSALPIAPGTHRLNENTILRTRAGSVVQGKTYRVNSIISWDGRNDLERAKIQPGEVLMFSSHLIHGLAVNAQPDTTRVALEFRLFPAFVGKPPSAAS